MMLLALTGKVQVQDEVGRASEILTRAAKQIGEKGRGSTKQASWPWRKELQTHPSAKPR